MSHTERGIVAAVLASFAAVYLLAVPASAVVILPLLALQVLAVRWRSHGVWLPCVQAVLALAATLGFGTSAGVLGFLGGSLLLTRLWPLFPLVAIAPLFITERDAADVTITVTLMSLVIYGLTRLAHRAEEVRVARIGLAAAAVARERLRLAAELNTGLGRGLAAITRSVGRAMADPERAEQDLGSAVSAARRALAEARESAADYRTTTLRPEGETASSMLADADGSVEVGADRPTGGREYALTVALFAVVLVGFCAKALLDIPGALLPGAVACLTLIVFLQLRSVRGRHMWSLALMALLTYVPILVFADPWLGVSGFLAGPILLAFPARFAWPLVAGVVVANVAASAALGLSAPVAANYAVSTLVTGLVVYGLLRLAQLVKELELAREGMVRSAVVEERLRAARDLHDLLGHSLAAILLKCELARRLDAPRAKAELAEVWAMGRRAEADMRAVSGERQEMSLEAEVESVRSVLDSAGVEVDHAVTHGPLHDEVETALSAVLREAATNILRHSTARTCTITMEAVDCGVRLRVRNDGAGTTGGGRRGSSGIGNLTTRLAVLGGNLSARAEGDRFQLVAWVPAQPAEVANAE